ncbi:MAG: site-specific integrase, partial [SAR324 cluster bacterium]|nr:site-specific integrase [SAR324 cluster bacterium]
RHAEWKEFRLEGKNPIWIIPPERMKMRREHQVPLADQTLEVLDRVREFSAEEILVFPGQQNPNRPMSENTLLYALYRMGYHSRATTHGFRSTASTILNESGRWHPDAIERQLAHIDANQVRKVYNRAEYLEERRRMMQWWADHLDTLSVPAEIINLRERIREHDTTRL